MTKYDKYDILIKNISKEVFLLKNGSKDKWEIPIYTKSQINKAGKIIASKTAPKEEQEQAIKILNNWRAAHAYPLQVICNNLRSRNPRAIVVQRLKRLESITNKIQRFPDMQLYKMQDLGGCRVIVDKVEQVYKTINNYKNSRSKHILKREYDYIANPKSSGYRSYHMVYQFHSELKETYNQNMFIEVQFRTKLQHIWATAVEMMGIYTKSNLKSSQGDEDILRFFKLVSSVFALQENMPVCPDTSNNLNELISEIKELDKAHKIISTLNSLNVIINKTGEQINHKGKNNKNTYYILILDYKEMVVTVKQFQSSKIENATKVYDAIEKDPNVNVVLVSANSFDTLRVAYPNYFADIYNFINILQSLLIKSNKIKD